MLSAIWAMTVLESLGTTCIFEASQEMPRNMVPSSTPMTMSVSRACFHSIGLKAGTPLEMASTPVMAAPPEAKACSSRKMLTEPVALRVAGRWAPRGGGRAEAALTRPVLIIRNMEMMNR